MTTSKKTVKSAKTPEQAKTRPAKTTIEAKKTGAEGNGTGQKVGYKNPPVHTRFKPGNVANPGGKPVGSRNRLQGDFMRELAEDFSNNGRAAIIACRTEKPDVYIKVIASLMPKEFEIKRPLEELSEDDLVAGVAALQSYLATQGNGTGVADSTQRKQTH